MSWDKPKSGKGWLILCIPPSFCVVLTALGAVIDPKDGNWMGWSLIGLGLALVSAFGISIWLVRLNKTAGSVIGAFLLCFICYLLIICAVSFAGCAAGSTFLPGMRFD
jgi:hypothetical protein